MQKSFTFQVSPEVMAALEQATEALRAQRPGQHISRSDTVRVAILAMANNVQRVANPDMREVV